MTYPAFFDEVETITVYDPLAEFLGSASDGRIKYSYVDAVKLAGHSCPTVAGAYLMTLKGLKALYGEQHPQRGRIKVEIKNDITAGTTGVVARIVGLITGAAQEDGFKGIAGHFDRRNLLFCNADIAGGIRFERLDTGASVQLNYHPEIVPPPPRLAAVMRNALSAGEDSEARRAFSVLWQDRVKHILIDSCDDPGLIVRLEMNALAEPAPSADVA